MKTFLRWLLGMGGAVACVVAVMLLVPGQASAQCANGVCRVSSYDVGYVGGSYGGGFGGGWNSGWSQPSYASQYYAPQYSQPSYYAPPIYRSQPAYYGQTNYRQRSYSAPYRNRSVTRVYGQNYGRYADGGACACGSPGCNCAVNQR